MIDPQSGQASQRLVVLDFSGTLSIAAVRFGQPASIESAVQECDLADQGIDARLLWSEIILPSWHEAITTRRGYESGQMFWQMVRHALPARRVTLRDRGRRVRRERAQRRQRRYG